MDDLGDLAASALGGSATPIFVVNDDLQQATPAAADFDDTFEQITQQTPQATQQPSTPSSTLEAGSRKNAKCSWNDDQVHLILEMWAEAKLSGQLNIDKEVVRKLVYREIDKALRERWPLEPFDTLKVARKINRMGKIWSVFIAIIKDSGVQHDEETGVISASDEQWAHWLDKYVTERVISLRNLGLKFRNLQANAFQGVREIGGTAVEATDVEALRRMTTSAVDEDQDEDIPATPATTATSTNKRAATPSTAGPSNKKARSSYNNDDTAIADAIILVAKAKTTLTMVPGAQRLEDAVADVQDRFGSKYSDEAIDAFCDILMDDYKLVSRYMASNEAAKERLFNKKTYTSKENVGNGGFEGVVYDV
jgi:hypothetical protein